MKTRRDYHDVPDNPDDGGFAALAYTKSADLETHLKPLNDTERYLSAEELREMAFWCEDMAALLKAYARHAMRGPLNGKGHRLRDAVGKSIKQSKVKEPYLIDVLTLLVQEEWVAAAQIIDQHQAAWSNDTVTAAIVIRDYAKEMDG